MPQSTGWFPLGAFALVALLVAFSGCGEPSASASAPAVPPPLVTLPPVAPATPAPLDAAVERPIAYACLADGLCQDEPGVCPKCKKPFTPVAIANPDPRVCPVTGDPVNSHHSAVIEGKVYFFCCNDCIQLMTRDPEKYRTAKPAQAPPAGAGSLAQ